MKPLSPAQSRAFSKLSPEWKTLEQLNEPLDVMRGLIRKGYAKRGYHHGVPNYRVSETISHV